MDNFVFGQYVPGNSLIHRMHPASKLLLSVLFIILVLLSNRWLNYGELFLLVMVSFWMTRVSLRLIYQGIKPLVIIILITASLQLLFDPSGRTLFQVSLMRITTGGLNSSSFVFCRFLLIIMISTLLTLSTPPTKLADGIRIILDPFRRLKVPVDTISLMISVALRFVPTLAMELRMIIKAQRSRGMLFHTGTVWSRIKKVSNLIVPLLFSSFEKARKLSYAMLSRGYQGNVKRTRYRQARFSEIDVMAWIVYISFGVVEIFSRR